MKILFYLTFTLITCLLPIYLLRKNWKEVGAVALIIIYFFILNSALIVGKIHAFHDTRYSYEIPLIIFKQWLDKPIPIGWNPYMNGGEPLYLYSNIFLWAPWVFFCSVNKVINLDPHTLFNMFWIFLFINFCVGGLLLFYVLYENFKVSLFSFIVLINSGMFFVNLAEPAGLPTMYYFPYILFCIISSLKTKTGYGLALAVIFLGAALNHYLPHYLLLVLCVFLSSMCIFLRKPFILKSQYKIILCALVISLLAASPALFGYREMRNYVSPTRGGLLPAGAMKFGQTGQQRSFRATFLDYKILIVPIKYIHHAFYIGIVPLLFIPFAFIGWRDRFIPIFFMSTIATLFLGTGNNFWGYRFLVKYIPGFNFIRHSFGLAQFVGFFLICLSGYGLRELFQKCKGTGIKLMLLLSTLIFLGAAFLIRTPKFNIVIFGSLCIIILFFTVSNLKPLNTKKLYLFIICILLIDLTWGYLHLCRLAYGLKDRAFNFNTIVYPLTRKFCNPIEYPLPPDFEPLISKEASLTNQNENFIFYRDSRLNDMLKLFIPKRDYERALGITEPIIYFTSHAEIFPDTIPRENFIKAVYETTSGPIFKETRKVVFSEKDIDFYQGNITEQTTKEPTIKYTKRDDPNELELSVDIATDGFLVRLENFHPNWHAFVDEKETRIYRANYSFQAIRLPTGTHRIKFKFSTLYPVLMWIHTICVFLTWVGFNLYLSRK